VQCSDVLNAYQGSSWLWWWSRCQRHWHTVHHLSQLAEVMPLVTSSDPGVSYTLVPSITTNSYLYRHDSYSFPRWHPPWPRQHEAPRTASVNDTDNYMEGVDVQSSAPAQQSPMLSVSRFHHVQDQKMESISHLLQSGRECTQIQIRYLWLKLWAFSRRAPL